MCLDIGASKTLIAAFSSDGELKKTTRFPTPKNYKTFLKDLAAAVKQEFGGFDFQAAACAVPGLIDRKNGIAIDFGNLPWHHVSIKNDLSDVLRTHIEIENDTKLGALSEARTHRQYKKVLYLTLSTGIGSGLIVNGNLAEELVDSEAGQMIINYKGKLERWEDVASGRAFANKYGRPAAEIDDANIWREFTDGIAQGLGQLLAVIQPDVVIIGGGLGAHLEKFETFLRQDLETKYKAKLVRMPPIIKAKRPEEAVIYGCYELIKDRC